MGRTVSHDITYQPSALAPTRLVRHVKNFAPKAVAVVQQHTGAAVPPHCDAIRHWETYTTTTWEAADLSDALRR